MSLFVWGYMHVDWWQWVLVGWLVASVALGAAIARWFRMQRD